MSFESVRGYIQLASGLGEVTRARAVEAAQGLLSMPGVGITTGKLAVQAGALAEELLAAATTNREHLTTLVRAEVDAAVTRLGLVAADKLKESQAEAARLRVEVAALRSASVAPAARTSAKRAPAKRSVPKKPAVKKSSRLGASTRQTAASPATTATKAAATKAAATKAAGTKAAGTKAAATKATTATKATATKATADRPRSAVTTRRGPAGT